MTNPITLDARQFGRAWMATSHARSKDPIRPVLAAHWLELYPKAINLVCCDSYRILRSAVGLTEADVLKKDPKATLIVATNPRADALMKWLRHGKDAPEELTVEATDNDVTFSVTNETLTCPLIKATPVNWRSVSKHDGSRSDAASFNPRYLGSLCRAMAEFAVGDVVLKPVRVEGLASLLKPMYVRQERSDGTELVGLLMPVRTDEERAAA